MVALRSKYLLILAVFLPKIMATGDPNQVILSPNSEIPNESQEIIPETIESSNVYISGDLLCSNDGCYPLIFEPTTEWQIIKPEQRLPAGLDIRVNLETGLKEAKIGDDTIKVASSEETKEKNNNQIVAKNDAVSDDSKFNYEFSDQFEIIRDSLDSGDYVTTEKKFEEILEFAHDYKHGFKIVSNEFDILSTICVNETLPLSLRELDARFIIGCVRNNPPVVEYIRERFPNFVRDLFKSINTFQDATEDVKFIVKRFINILTVMIEADPTYIVGINDFNTMKKVYYTIDDKQMKIKILEIISSFIDRVHQDDIAPVMKRDGILFVVPEISDWVSEYTKFIKDVDTDEAHLRKFFTTLHNLKTDFGKDLKVDPSFLNWLVDQVEVRKQHLQNGLEERDPEQDEFDRKLIDSRHLVFGNELADSIKRFHDEL